MFFHMSCQRGLASKFCFASNYWALIWEVKEMICSFIVYLSIPVRVAKITKRTFEWFDVQMLVLYMNLIRHLNLCSIMRD